MRELYSDKGWTEFMGAVFALLHQVKERQADGDHRRTRVAGPSRRSWT